MLKPYKFLVTAVAHQLDENGEVIGEAVVANGANEPFVVFGCDALAKWAAEFPDKLAEAAT